MDGHVSALPAPSGQLPEPAVTLTSDRNDANGFVRDGVFYLGVAHLALLLGFVCYSLASNDVLLSEDPPGVMSVVLCAGWAVLSILGFWKMLRASFEGVQSRWVAAAKLGMVAYGLAALVLALLLSRASSSEIRYVSVFTFLLLSNSVLGRTVLYRRVSYPTAPGDKSLRWFGLAGTWLLAAVGLLSPELSKFHWVEDICLRWGNEETPWLAAGLLLVLASLCALYMGFRQLWLDGRTADSVRLVRWSRYAAIVWAGILGIFLLSTYEFSDTIDRMTAVACYLGVAAGAVLGWLLAKIRSRGRKLWPRYLILCLPLSILLGYSAAETANLAMFFEEQDTSQFDKYYSGEKHPWIWHQPECLRVPILSALTWACPRNSYGISRTKVLTIRLGLCSVETLATEALSATSVSDQRELWITWHQRSPDESLAQALDVPVSQITNLPLTLYDDGAGTLIGAYGTKEDIIKRLKGSYTDALCLGISYGLLIRPVIEDEVNQALIDFYDTHVITDRRNYSFAWVANRRPGQLLKLSLAWLKDPTPSHMSSLPSMLFRLSCQPNQPGMEELVQYALTNPNPALRTLFLNAWRWRSRNIPALLELKMALACLKGSLPGSTLAEQRLAYVSLHNALLRVGRATDLNQNFTTLTQSDLNAMESECLKYIEALEAKEKERAEARSSPKSQ